MARVEFFVVVDKNSGRKNSIEKGLTKEGLICRDFDCILDSSINVRGASVILCADYDDALLRLFEKFDEGSFFVPVIAYRSSVEPTQVARAMQLGVIDYFCSPMCERDLFLLIGGAIARSVDFIARESERTDAQNTLSSLTDRENEVLIGLSCGNSSKEIARRLSISHRTVEVHRSNMLRKLRASGTGDAVRIALSARRRAVPLEAGEALSTANDQPKSSAVDEYSLSLIGE